MVENVPSRRLTVLNVAYPLAPVGPNAVGGAEQVLTQIDAALVRAGHQSLVVACEGSVAAGTLIATPGVFGPLRENARAEAQARHRRTIEDTLSRCPVDLVHLHGIDFPAYLPPPGPPVLVTLHLPPEWYPGEVFRVSRPETYLHCVSAAQERACPAGARVLPAIPNGVACPAVALPHARRSFAFALGRICPEKGFHHALDAARLARHSLLLAGQVFAYPEHQHYFNEEIVPRLDRQRRFIGPAGLARKRRLLASARCLLVPSLAPETSSLVAMEALAHGTPVVAFPAGALPEIIEHGKTGFLVNNVQEMAAAMADCGQLDAQTCRAAARERFSLERMTARYLEVYTALAAARPVNSPIPADAASPFLPPSAAPGGLAPGANFLRWQS